MNKLSAYIKSMRLRTLPLSLSGVCLGMMLAYADYRFSLSTALWIMLTTVCLQILSNIANELGDTLSGVDGEQRVGPQYSLGEGGLTVRNMKWFIIVVAICCIGSGLMMIRSSFGTLFSLESICLMMLGAAAMGGAIKYTLGRNPYGYRGLGDISVFTFFGIVSVLGAYFVAAREIPGWIMILPAAAIGCFSVAVLNVNNIRDMKSDEGLRITTPLRIGERNVWPITCCGSRTRGIMHSSSPCPSSSCILQEYGGEQARIWTRCFRFWSFQHSHWPLSWAVAISCI